MNKFTPKVSLVSDEVHISSDFANYLNSNPDGWRNLTGGVMTFYATDDCIIVYGCNLPCKVEDNKLFIDEELMIDFNTEEINVKI